MNPYLGRRLRYGMVGGGPGAFIGPVHRMAAALDGEWELVAGAFSSRLERSREMGAKLGLAQARVYSSYLRMAEFERRLSPRKRIDAVVVTTPNHLHAEVAEAFLRIGIHVVCDKPLATSVPEAEGLCGIVEEGGPLLFVTYNYSGYPMVKEARARIQQGELGRIRKVVGRYHQGWLSQSIEKEGQKQASWRQDPDFAGPSSAIADIGSHLHQLARYVTGLPIKALAADAASVVDGRRLEDDAVLLTRFPGGVRGVYSVSQVAAGEENDLSLSVYGSHGALKWRQETPGRLIVSSLDGPWRFLSKGTAGLSSAALAATRLPPGHPEGFISAFANLYRAIGRRIGARISGVQPRPEEEDAPDHRDGLRGARFVELALKAARSGAWEPA